jgi:hypothetical protein
VIRSEGPGLFNVQGLQTRLASLLRNPPLIAGTVYALVLIYSFPWLRIPDVYGVALPFQRLLAWFGLGLLFLAISLRGGFRANRAVRFYLGVVSLFFAVLILTTLINASSGEVFSWLRYLSETSKYVAVFSTAFLVYYALEHRLVRYRTLELLLVVSAAASIIVAYILLVLYWTGFRSTNEILANSFGGSLGVWPTASFLPRLAGPTAEPQQFSVVYLTGLMLMLSPRYVRYLWPLALFGLLALLLSQSKFALISLVAVGLYLDTIYKQHRLIFAALLVLAIPPGLAFVSSLPVFETTLRQGFAAQAFTDRLENLGILTTIIREQPFDGIGVGQYGTYRGELLFGDPHTNPNYAAGNDIVAIFAETGAFGFGLVALLFGVLFSKFIGVLPRLRPAEYDCYLPFLIGALAIFLNMFIGYEFLHAFFWVNLGVLLYLYRHWGLRIDAAHHAHSPI